MERLLRAVVNSWNGLRFALKSEAAFRQELAVFVPAVPLAFLVTQDSWKRLALIGAACALLAMAIAVVTLVAGSKHVAMERLEAGSSI